MRCSRALELRESIVAMREVVDPGENPKSPKDQLDKYSQELVKKIKANQVKRGDVVSKAAAKYQHPNDLAYISKWVDKELGAGAKTESGEDSRQLDRDQELLAWCKERLGREGNRMNIDALERVIQMLDVPKKVVAVAVADPGRESSAVSREHARHYTPTSGWRDGYSPAAQKAMGWTGG